MVGAERMYNAYVPTIRSGTFEKEAPIFWFDFVRTPCARSLILCRFVVVFGGRQNEC